MDIGLPLRLSAVGALLAVGFFAMAAAAPHASPTHHAAVPAHVAHPSRHPSVVAQAAPSDARPDDRDNADHARNAGVVEGQVVSVDYQRGMIGLLTPDRGKVDVMVLPSTNIQGRGDGFHTIADIGRGSHLRVFLSQRAGQFFAQIIHLR